MDHDQGRLRRVLRTKRLWALVAFLLFVWLNNSSLGVHRPQGATVVAHRGMGQTFDLHGVKWDTNTAAIIHELEHPYIENTLPAMHAAFDSGADIVEFDVRLTKDKQLAVFHDDILQYRTDGRGRVADHTMDELRSLDVGYGYTADGGKTFPLRGTGKGLLVSIDDVFRTFPDRQFLVHIKDGGSEVGPVLVDFFDGLDASTLRRVSVYGNDPALDLLSERYPTMKTLSKSRMIRALVTYELIGWTGYVPKAARNMELHIPLEYARWLWGWPDKFLQRMDGANSRVVLVRYVEGWSDGFDSEGDLRALPSGYSGGVWTNRVDVVGPLLKAD